jgi:hypothetical protein
METKVYCPNCGCGPVTVTNGVNYEFIDCYCKLCGRWFKHLTIKEESEKKEK